MAAQTEAPDDLIAELARLMADDARDGQPAADAPQPTPVRIPGDQPSAPAPRFDFVASAETRPAASPVRIPGDEKPVEPSSAEPFVFDFNISPASSAPLPSAEKQTPAAEVEPAVVPPTPEPEQGILDQDSLADLIAAELAADMGDATSAEPEQVPSASENDVDSAPGHRPSEDSFGVPPVFGLGSGRQGQPVAAAPTPPQPMANASVAQPQPVAKDEPEGSDALPDPLDEIERLVGPAVRLNAATATAATTSTPTPALRSLATPVAVEPENRSDAAPQAPRPAQNTAPPAVPAVEVNSVDEAILAAAAATGAHVEWVNAGSQDDAESDEAFETAALPPRASGFRINRAVAGPVVAVGLLAIAGLGLYWMLGQGGSTSGPAPLLVADTTPTKEVPEATAGSQPQQSVVFNEISGADTPADEQIVSRDQADTDAVVAASNAGSSTGVIADISGDSVDPNQDGLVNRKVRTVTVRPDGTIVSGEDSLAGSTILPVDRPNVPDVPGADFSTPDLIANANQAATTASTDTPANTAVAPAVPVVEPGSVVSVVDATGATITGRSVTIPMQRPDDFSTIAAAAIANAAAQPVASAPVQQAVAVAPTAGNASAYVQLASQRSEEAARQSAQAATTRYGVLFGGASPEIQRVDLGERGIYYRVLVPAASRDSAANICTNIKAAGGDCLLL